MSVSVETSKYALLAVARQDWINTQQSDSARTGKPAQPVPADDNQLIADEPPLEQEIQALEAQQIESNSASSAGGTPVANTGNNKTAYSAFSKSVNNSGSAISNSHNGKNEGVNIIA